MNCHKVILPFYPMGSRYKNLIFSRFNVVYNILSPKLILIYKTAAQCSAIKECNLEVY